MKQICCDWIRCRAFVILLSSHSWISGMHRFRRHFQTFLGNDSPSFGGAAMFSALLVCTACLAFDQPATVATESPGISARQRAYLDAKSQLGRSPDDHVRLALWCEAHRMETERQKHLTIAVLKDPAHATARGLLGLVAFGGGWHSPEAIGSKLEADQSHKALRAEYNALPRTGNSADAHWKLALWSERQGLNPQANAHLVAVTQLDPARDAAWTSPWLPAPIRAVGHRRPDRRGKGRIRRAEKDRQALDDGFDPMA